MPVKVGLKYIDLWKSNLEKEIVKYEEQNDEKGQIVFYGPSYFTRWDGRDGGLPLEDAIKGASGKKCVVNRGFGSSCSEHQLYYYPRMVRAIEPKVLVYGSYGNFDCFGYTAEESMELAQRVVMYTLTDFPEAEVYLCGAVPFADMTHERIANARIYSSMVEEFAKTQSRCHYINLLDHPEFIDPSVRKNLFISDGIHPNGDGYEVYGRIYREALKDVLAKF